jgi:protein-arginine deiminase
MAWNPDIVNGIVLSDLDFGAPDPHGPDIGGVDFFRQYMQDQLAAHGITVHWIEDWYHLHLLYGEVHCGTNVLRQVPTLKWWEVAQ